MHKKWRMMLSEVTMPKSWLRMKATGGLTEKIVKTTMITTMVLMMICNCSGEIKLKPGPS